MIYEEIASNKRKSYFLLFVFLIIIIALGLVLGLFFNNVYFGAILAALISIGYVLISYYAGDKMILAVSKARPVEKKTTPTCIIQWKGCQ